MDVKDELTAIFIEQDASYWFDEKEQRGKFPNGWDHVICTSWAVDLRDRLGPDRVEVVGFMGADNPGSAIAAECEGHDFALVDGRYIADGWLVGIGVCLPLLERTYPGIYDLEHPDDEAEISRLYGDRSKWVPSGPPVAVKAPGT